MDEYMIVLRIVHIVAAATWVGAAIIFAIFIEPTVSALGPAGGQFMGHLAEKKKLPAFMAAVSITAIVAGALLYWRDSSGFDSEWIQSATGTTFTIGAVAAILAWLLGFFIIRPNIDRMGALRATAATDPGVMPQIGAIMEKVRKVGLFNVLLLLIATVAMATARYV